MLEIKIGEIVVEDEIDIGEIEVDAKKVYPALEDLEVTPSGKKQVFKHPNSYGYDEVVVNEVESEELNIIPSAEEQVKEGLYGKVTVAGDSNLVPENIKGGVEIFKVKGTAQMADEELTASYLSALDDSLGANVTKLPSNITKIRDYAFYGCKNLKLTELPENLTEIGSCAFQDCENLMLIELPKEITTMGNSAFRNCKKLALTKLPDNLTKVSAYIFYLCDNLPLTELSEGITEIGDYAFCRCYNLTLTELPEGITKIGRNAFDECTGLALAKLPENLTLTSNSSSVFRYCRNIKIKEIPSATTYIPSSIFQYCSEIIDLTCLGAITDIQTYAFENCTKLTKFAMPNITELPTLSNANAFRNTPIASGTGYIYVPDNLVESFKTATNWSTYASQIKGISEWEGTV